MEIISKVKNILLNPKTEWEVISEKNDTHSKVLVSYLIPLALIPAIAGFIGFGLFRFNLMGLHSSFIGLGIRHAVTSLVSTLGGAYLSAWIIANLADKFGSTNNFDRSFSLVAYSYTPMCVAGILLLLPNLSVVAALCGLYGLYLLYLGLAPMMSTPEEKNSTYFIVSLLCVIVVSAILSTVMGALILSTSGLIF